MENTEKVTILEYVNEYGQYIFYAVYRKLTPKQAVERYIEDSGLDEDIVIETDADDPEGEAGVDDTCRAYRVPLEE